MRMKSQTASQPEVDSKTWVPQVPGLRDLGGLSLDTFYARPIGSDVISTSQFACDVL
jgi:hypothetical protein